MFEVRTDLAVEENERITKAQEEAKGITVTEEDFEEEQIHITTVRITTENGAKQMRITTEKFQSGWQKS